jgi:hypothetical protein
MSDSDYPNTIIHIDVVDRIWETTQAPESRFAIRRSHRSRVAEDLLERSLELKPETTPQTWSFLVVVRRSSLDFSRCLDMNVNRFHG